MSQSPDNRRLFRTALVIAAIGLPICAGLLWYGLKLGEDAQRRRVMAANEQAAAASLGQIAAAQQLYLESSGEYGTFRQLVEAGVFQAPLEGESLVSSGYRFTIEVMPRAEGHSPLYAARADPVNTGGDGATGNRHFYTGSETTGIRYAEGRPAGPTDRPLPRREEAY